MGDAPEPRPNIGCNLITVDSPVGTITGFIDKKTPKVAQFLGIPFAEPPIGSLRWLPPVSKSHMEHIDATAFGPSCCQIVGGAPSVYNSDAPEFKINDGTSEDCLTLSIWVPAFAINRHQPVSLPVIVWLFGGAYAIGGSTVPYQNPCNWVESSQRHIVVAINYRLNIFGFPNAAGLHPKEQNLGLYDQRLGLKWVHEHIHAFGGDPNRLTHWGQSAGARCVDNHAFSHRANPLVRNLIMHSGTTLPLLPVSEPGNKQFSYVTRGLGFTGGDAAEELAFMRDQPADSITRFLKAHGQKKIKDISLRFQPIVDGESEFNDYEERARSGNFSRLPAIIGITGNEGNSLVPYALDGIDTKAADAITKGYFLEPANQTTHARRAFAPTFRFIYTDPCTSPSESAFPNISPLPWERAYHCSELPLIFGTHSSYRSESTAMEWRVAAAWQELYVVFAEEGEDGLRKLGWLDESQGKGVIFGRGDRGWEVVDVSEVVEM